jgi:hypothetical protein
MVEFGVGLLNYFFQQVFVVGEKRCRGVFFFSLGGLQNVARLAKMGQEPF